MLCYCLSSCTSSHTWCYATACRLALLHRHDATLRPCTFLVFFATFVVFLLIGVGWGGVGWDDNVHLHFSQAWCYVIVCRLALVHIHDATLLPVVLHFFTGMMLRYCMSSCTCSHTWCYATACRLALLHRHDATLRPRTFLAFFATFVAFLLIGVGWGGVGWDDNVHLHFSQAWCYVIVCRLALVHIHDATLLLSSCISSQTWCYATVCRLALVHILDATLLSVVLHFLTDMMLRYCLSSCISSQTWCYATVCCLALVHILDATLLYVVLHFLTDMMLRYCRSSCTFSHIWCYGGVVYLMLKLLNPSCWIE